MQILGTSIAHNSCGTIRTQARESLTSSHKAVGHHNPHGMMASSVDFMHVIRLRSGFARALIISHSGALAGYKGRWRTVPERLVSWY